MNDANETRTPDPDTALTGGRGAGVLRSVGDGRRGAARPWWRMRVLTILVLVVIVAISVVLTTIVQRVVDDQEERLLDQRTRELTGVLDSAVVSGLQVPLLSGAIVANLTQGAPEQWGRAAGALVPEGTEFVLVGVDDDGATVLSGGDDHLRPGDTLDGERLDAVRRAVEDADPDDRDTWLTVTDVLEGVGEGTEVGLGFALAGNAAPDGTAVYLELSFDSNQSNSIEEGEPFADLDVALYAGAEATDENLVLLSGSGVEPGGDRVGRAALAVGQDEWVVLASPRSSLVGSAADASPWIVLGAGIAIALIAAALTEVLLRRQDYAVALVDERTAALESTQAQLVRSERLAAIGGLASAVGHELRNPLGVISNAHYLLRTKLGDGVDADLRRHLATAERETAAATLIVSDLLEFAKARDPIPIDVPLADLIAESLEVAPAPPGIEVHHEVGPELAVRADRDQLRQVVLNLVTNAYDAMGEHGTLQVDAERRDGTVRLRVADDGTGIDDATKEQIFEPFFTSKAKGIGLGLTVTRRIVEAHGGALTVGDRPGGGTEFTVEFPAVDGDRTAP